MKDHLNLNLFQVFSFYTCYVSGRTGNSGWARKILSVGIFIFATCSLSAQSAYEHISNKNLYDFIDEMASDQIIDVNTAIKPYSREQISKWLLAVEQKKDQLSKPQLAHLEIFRKEFQLESGQLKTGKLPVVRENNKLGVHLLPPEVGWRDSLLRAVIRPVFGTRYFGSTNENFYTGYAGLEGIVYVGKNLGIYANYRKNFESYWPLISPKFFTQEPGGKYKTGSPDDKLAEFDEMRGGITWSWAWGSFGLLKENLQWGDGSNGTNILSGQAPAFPMLQFKLNPVKWFEFTYFHGWLASDVVDSTRSYFDADGEYQEVFRDKYIAANMFTFIPFKRLNLSVGNAIIYSDVPVQPAYLIPFSFFKSIDHTINYVIQNQNSMMYLNFSSRQIKHLHLYFSVFVDEFSIARVTDKNRNNFISMKGGVSVSGWPMKDIGFTAEATRSQPNTFEHYIPATTFETSQFNLGHYLKGNSQDVYLEVRYNLYSTIGLKASYCYAMHGNDYPYDYNLPIEVDEIPVLAEKSWSHGNFMLRAEMQPLPNVNVFASYSVDQVKGYDLDGKSAQYYLDRFSPTYLHGNSRTFVVGFNIGF